MQVKIFFFISSDPASDCWFIMLPEVFHLPTTRDNADLSVRKRNGLLYTLLSIHHRAEMSASFVFLTSLYPLHYDKVFDT